MKHRPLANKVVISNGSARHITYVNAESRTTAGAHVVKTNTLLLRFPSWHISYIL